MPCYLFCANFQFVLFWFFYSLVLWLRSLSKSYCCYYYRSIYICCSAIMCLLVGLIFIFFMWWLLKFPSWFLSVHFSVFSSTDWCLNVIFKRYIYANLFPWYTLLIPSSEMIIKRLNLFFSFEFDALSKIWYSNAHMFRTNVINSMWLIQSYSD